MGRWDTRQWACSLNSVIGLFPSVRQLGWAHPATERTLRLAYDGVEYIGRLWFSDPSSDQMGIPDHGAVPGRTIAEAVEVARKLTPQDLERRCHRALADKRRYIRLRRATEEIITKIKYMNRVAVTMRHGMLDSEGASRSPGHGSTRR